MILKDLLDRVKGATGPDRKLDEDIAVWTYPELATFQRSPSGGWIHPEFGKIAPADGYTSSLDAALALVERRLPGWGCTITLALGGGSTATVFAKDGQQFDINGDANISLSEWLDQGNIHLPTAPLAVCAALLSALVADAGPSQRDGEGRGERSEPARPNQKAPS